MMIMKKLCHYVWSFLKLLGMLNILIVIRSSRLRSAWKLLKKHTKKWETNSSLLKKTFDSDSVYGDIDKYMKTKIKSFGDKLHINFQGKKYQKKTYTNVRDW